MTPAPDHDLPPPLGPRATPLSKTRFQALLRFTDKRERARAGAFIIEGWRWLEEALELPGRLECLLVSKDAVRTPADHALLGRALARADAVHETTPEQIARLAETATSSGIAALVPWRPNAPTPPVGDAPALLVALDAVADPGNAGTIVRTADWFGAAGVLFGPGSVELTNPKCARATMGSLFHLPIAEPAALDAELARWRDAGFTLVGAALGPGAVDLPDFRWPRRAVLVIGNEANGIAPDILTRLDTRLRIPPHGRAESLNAAIAAAVLLADWRRHPAP